MTIRPMIPEDYPRVYALAALSPEGISKVALVVFDRNRGGNAFWEKQGFTTRPDLVYRNRALIELRRLDS